jgi:hypothetical protein
MVAPLELDSISHGSKFMGLVLKKNPLVGSGGARI